MAALSLDREAEADRLAGQRSLVYQMVPSHGGEVLQHTKECSLHLDCYRPAVCRDSQGCSSGKLPACCCCPATVCCLQPHSCHAAALVVKQQEQQEWQFKVDSIDAGDLPRYIEASVITLGTLDVCCDCGSSWMWDPAARRICCDTWRQAEPPAHDRF